MDKNNVTQQADINIAVFSGTYYALYMFVFLLVELVLQDRAGAVLGAEKVVPVYATGLIATVCGYLLLPFSRALVSGPKWRRAMLIAASALFLISLSVIIFTDTPFFFMLLVGLSMLAVGYVGGYVHLALALAMNGRRHLGMTVGGAICISILLQYIIQNFTTGGAALILSMAVSLIVAVRLSVKYGEKSKTFPSDRPPRPGTIRAGYPAQCGVFITVTALMSITMGISDGILTSLHAQGDLVLSAYPRLFYAAALVLAGYIADIRERRYLPITTACFLLLSVIVTSFLDGSYGYTISMSFLYFLGGFVIVYFSVAFLEIAPHTPAPALWAGMGRIVRSIATGLISIPGNMLFRYTDHQMLTMVSLALSLAVFIVFYFSGALGAPFEKKEEKQVTGKKEGRERKKNSFAKQYGLTEREKEVTAVVADSDDNIKEIADRLGLSERVLQRHLASVYEKTGVKARLALVRLYYEYCLKDEEGK